MVLIPFTIYVEVTGLEIGVTTVGFSVDTPLPSKITGTKYAIGIIDIPIVGTGRFETTTNVNIGTGDHYVILGIQPSDAIIGYRLRITGAGTSIDRSFGVIEPIQYIYIVFNMDKNNNIRVISSGTIAPGGSPIATPGGGDIFPGDLGDTIMTVTASMMQIMIPMMMINIMMSMMTGIISSVTGMMI